MDQLHAVAVNARFLLAGKLEGIGRFTDECLKRMVASHPECTFYFLFDREYDQRFIYGPNVVPVVLYPPARHPFLWYWWFEISVTRWLSQNRPQVFLSTDGFCSLRTSVPQTVVFHDLAFEHYPEQIPLLAGWFYRRYTPRYVQKAKVKVAVSRATARDIESCYGLTAKDIKWVPNAAGAQFHPLTEEEKQVVRSQWTKGSGYLLYVGALHPRKNILGILEAYRQYRSEDSGKLLLVLAGRLAWKSDAIKHALENHPFKKEILVLGHTQTRELAALMASAEALLYPSFFEGFGIPLLEAMKSGVPVITSNCSAMPEVAEDAAVFINPHRPEELTRAILQITTNPVFRKELIEKGLLRHRAFSWEMSAEMLWNACVDALTP